MVVLKVITHTELNVKNNNFTPRVVSWVVRSTTHVSHYITPVRKKTVLVICDRTFG